MKILLIFLLAMPTLAATVTLNNGDVLSGDIVTETETDLTLSHPVLGQIVIAKTNIAPPPAPKTDPKVDGETKASIDIGGEFKDGNSNSKGLHFQADYEHRKNKNRYIVGADHSYGESNGVRDKNESELDASYDRFLTDKLYWTNNLNLFRDEIADIKLRAGVGTGLGYQFYDTDITTLKGELGINYVHERLGNDDTEDYPALRWAVDWTYKIIPDRLHAFHNHDGLIDLKESENITVTSETGFKLPLSAHYHGLLQANVDWDNSPADGTENMDTTWLVGLGYVF